ncbi:NAD-dependent epimerase [Xanthobacter sp. TB0139]|uniref:NAD-dependent epimerase n=1 Tax=Xanthobacter sp. TB0139 TaxID=3459178 RepID=UPI0040398279
MTGNTSSISASRLSGRPVLVTGVAGFIGAALAHRLLGQGIRVVGVDNLNDYYDVRLKLARLATLQSQPGFTFEKLDLAQRVETAALFTHHQPVQVVNLAAQAGVRHSLENPAAYVDSNLVGFANVLEGCRHNEVEHLIFASSSSVYGANTLQPFSVEQGADHPISLYAATKRANELMAHSYSHLYRLPATGLRFFTVYGPWGRPDMAVFLFTDAIWHGRPIQVFNDGHMSRDFTYIDDAVEAVMRLLDHVPGPNPQWSGKAPDPASSSAPWRLYNIGNHAPAPLRELISHIEAALGRKAVLDFQPMQAGDVETTYADVSALAHAVDFAPRTDLKTGITAFVNWYLNIYLPRIVAG